MCKSLILLSIVVSLSSVINGEQKNETAGPTVRYCYECTSALHPGCADAYEGSEKFPHEKLLKVNYSRDCTLPEHQPHVEPGQKPPRAVGCRKILQEVEGKTRVVRECAYTKPDDGDKVDGLKRTGNQGVRLFYYQCAKDYCNTAPQKNTISIFLAIFSTFFLFFLARC